MRSAPLALALLATSGCMIGPDYARPVAPTADRWLAEDARLGTGGETIDARWWRVFGDPALDELVERAYGQNLTLQAAGLRVIEAQARRGIAIGELYPQRQAVTASYQRAQASLEGVLPVRQRGFESFQAGFDAAWELDLWGRFRRAIESSDASLLAAVADYDDVLVSLVAEVARTYVLVRVLDERLTLARDNVRVQRESFDVANVRYQAGGTSELDVQQASTLLADTEATIPDLEAQRRQALDSLSVLLGVPPTDFDAILARSSGIPAAPDAVAVGIPADLLRRRPDVRRAERILAAQSARIGVAKADLLPRLTLAGSVGLSAADAANFFTGRAFQGVGGPSVDWAVFNYGRIVNAVRVEDATFQELAATYADTVLRAQRDVEDALAGYLRGIDRVAALGRSVTAADRAVDLALIQYREGASDYTRVLTAQQSKLQENDRLASARGAVTTSVIALYKALGGGWEMREPGAFVPAATREEMRGRTWWGGTLQEERTEGELEQAASGTEGDREPGFLRWRAWWPRW